MSRKRLLALLAVIGFCVTVAILVSCLNSQNLAYQGKTTTAWLFQLSAADSKVRAQAEAAFEALGTNAVPELSRLVRANDSRWRKLIWSHTRLLPKLVRGRVLSWVSPPVAHATRPAAAQVLGKLGPAAAPAVPALIQMLRQGSPYEQVVAADSLGQIGAPAVAPLINILVHDEGAAGGAAARALLRHYRWTGQRLPAGEYPTGDPTAFARQQAIEMLEASGRADEVAIRVLAGAAQDPAPGVRLAALKALAHTNRDLKPALPQLAACSRDESPVIREWSARTLGRIGPPARPAIPALTRLAQDKEESVRVVAQTVLAAIEAGQTTNLPTPPK